MGADRHVTRYGIHTRGRLSPPMWLAWCQSCEWESELFSMDVDPLGTGGGDLARGAALAHSAAPDGADQIDSIMKEWTRR